ncbi:MAG: bacterioferritin [Phycisphaerae bacterium]|nr:bacterioferritin [Phycisphaerae bacterium]
MKGNEKLLAALNCLLAEELTAINQYTVHAEMNANWGYSRLHDNFEHRARTEMKHAESLIERILFLEGRPIVSELRKLTIGADLPKMAAGDLGFELAAVKEYNKVIKLAVEVGDNATKELLEKILKDEDSHVDELETLRDQIQQMGLQLFLTTQTKKE